MEQFFDSMLYVCSVIGIEIDGSIATNLIEHRNVGDQNRTAATHGLYRWQAKALIDGRKNETHSQSIEMYQFLITDTP